MYLFKGRAGNLLADINKNMKLKVIHEPSLILWKSTSHVGTNEGIQTTVTFKPKEAVEANFRRVWNTEGYQNHLTAKDKQRGII